MLKCPVVQEKNEKFGRSSVSYPDLQSKIWISKNSLRHDPDLKKSAPFTSLVWCAVWWNRCDSAQMGRSPITCTRITIMVDKVMGEGELQHDGGGGVLHRAKVPKKPWRIIKEIFRKFSENFEVFSQKLWIDWQIKTFHVKTNGRVHLHSRTQFFFLCRMVSKRQVYTCICIQIWEIQYQSTIIRGLNLQSTFNSKYTSPHIRKSVSGFVGFQDIEQERKEKSDSDSYSIHQPPPLPPHTRFY